TGIGIVLQQRAGDRGAREDELVLVVNRRAGDVGRPIPAAFGGQGGCGRIPRIEAAGDGHRLGEGRPYPERRSTGVGGGAQSCPLRRRHASPIVHGSERSSWQRWKSLVL